MRRRRGRSVSLVCTTITILAALNGYVEQAHGQGFMVKPMRMEVFAGPGQRVEIPLELHNTSQEVRELQVRLVELSQTTEGNWRIIEPDSGEDTSRLASCMAWITLGATRAEVPALEAAEVMVRIDVPQRVRGTYFAGLIVETPRPPGATGLVVRVRFLIPVIIQIEGMPVRQQVVAEDMGMLFHPPANAEPGTTSVSMQIANPGQTYSRLRGNVRVQREHEGRWRPVASADLREVGIIPGVTLNLAADIGRRLPSGRYRLTGTLYVDGRRLSPIEREIEFEGDPAVTALAVDTALLLDPEALILSAAPGATRTAVLQVSNESDEMVEIEAAAVIPPSLRGVALGELRGDELSAAEWLSVNPSSFRIRPTGRQNVRVVLRVPRDPDAAQGGNLHANYYGQLVLRASYPDGQSAGETTAMVFVENAQAEKRPLGQIVRTGLAAGENSQYIIQARVSNVGNVHFMPRPRATLLSGRGERIADAPLEGDDSIMLPLASRDFSGVMDFDGVDEGAYLLRVDFEHGPGLLVSERIPVRVASEAGQKLVSVIQSERERAALEAAEETGPGQGDDGDGGGELE